MYRLTALCEDARTLIARLSAVAVGLGAWLRALAIAGRSQVVWGVLPGSVVLTVMVVTRDGGHRAVDARILRRRRGRWTGRCPRGCRGDRTCRGFLRLRAPSTAGLTRTDCAVIAPPLWGFSLVGRTVTQLPAVTSGRPADVNAAESAHWKHPAAKRSGTDSTAAATATPTEPCTSSWSCACVATNSPATTSPAASRKAKPKTRSCDASNAIAREIFHALHPPRRTAELVA